MVLKIYCSHIHVNDKVPLKSKGPLILASNHPNSFLDAIIIASCFKEPVHFLAMGEITDKFLFQQVKNAFHIIPVYRLKDKNENQDLNEKSFSACVDVLLNNGIVLIFSEGISENKWQLGPMKKVTARITMAAINQESLKFKLQIQPIGINYNSFNRTGKTVIIQFAEPILIRERLTGNTETEKIQSLNILIRENINDIVLQTVKLPERAQFLARNSPPTHSYKIKELQDKLNEERNQTYFSKLEKPGYLISLSQTISGRLMLVLLLAVPGIIGWVSHGLLYYPLKFFIGRKTGGSAYHDSAMFTIPFFTYPVYWIFCNILGYIFFKNVWIQVLLICMPVFALITNYWKKNIQKIQNYFILTSKERSLLAGYFS
ncbi:MAG TPA: 1-acyl-sn-glycerol-3-phosphate acyltransferase [Puia sp.]|nr:1-acyl-sn-glycerol-3-phosphate acyltransferase [Puia sp.]